MSYLNHTQIEQLVARGEMLNVDPECINTASLDIRLGNIVLIEGIPENCIVDYRARDQLTMAELLLDDDGIVLAPGQIILAHSMEYFNFADDTAALLRSKSSMGRIFFEHMDAGWIDPGFYGALTFEFVNSTQRHWIRIRPGDRVGQLVIFKGEMVAPEHSYRVRGNYNGQVAVKQAGFKEPK